MDGKTIWVDANELKGEVTLENMPKATPSISIPVMNTHPSPAQYKGYGELRYLLGDFLLQAGNPAQVLYLLLD